MGPLQKIVLGQSAWFLVGTLSASFVARSQSAPVFDPAQLPHVSGIVREYTLIPRAAVDGFFLDDGTQVLTAPPLSDQIQARAHRGDHVTVYGLKASAHSLMMALAVVNDASHEMVLLGEIPLLLALGGPLPAGHGAPQESATSTNSSIVTIKAIVERVLYGPRGTVSGALLKDGTVVRVSSSEAERAARWLQPGNSVVIRGENSESPVGRLILAQALGPAEGRLVELAAWDGPR